MLTEPLMGQHGDARRVGCLWIKGGSNPSCICFVAALEEAICPQINMQDSADKPSSLSSWKFKKVQPETTSLSALS